MRCCSEACTVNGLSSARYTADVTVHIRSHVHTLIELFNLLHMRWPGSCSNLGASWPGDCKNRFGQVHDKVSGTKAETTRAYWVCLSHCTQQSSIRLALDAPL